MNNEEREELQQRTYRIARQIDGQIDHGLIFVGAYQRRGDRRSMTADEKDDEADTIALKLEVHFSSSDVDRILEFGLALKAFLEAFEISG